MADPRTVYLAGELFSVKHLAGNAALADRLAAVSGGRFRCVLPQDLAQGGPPRAIRDQDLSALLGCDAAVFHYDGLELDSGTVVEYLTAKFADIPAVLVRTDFRHAGDQPGGDPWNLMNSFYPRTAKVVINSMELYHECLEMGRTAAQAADAVILELATRVDAALDAVLALPPVLPRGLGPAVYEWLALMPGFANPAGAREELARVHREKVAKGLL
jgi:hypothetical protein